MGRVSMFPEPGGKNVLSGDPSFWVRACLSTYGKRRFEQARIEVTKLWTQETGRTSAGATDADTVEYLLRGKAASRAIFRQRKAS